MGDESGTRSSSAQPVHFQPVLFSRCCFECSVILTASQSGEAVQLISLWFNPAKSPTHTYLMGPEDSFKGFGSWFLSTGVVCLDRRIPTSQRCRQRCVIRSPQRSVLDATRCRSLVGDAEKKDSNWAGGSDWLAVPRKLIKSDYRHL